MSALTYDATVAGRDVAVRLDVAAGETVAVLGPNGAGKSTVLGVIAGLVRPTSGRVALGGRDLAGVPPHDRRIALLAQDPLLFPHLSALDNVAFAPRARGTARRTAREQARSWLDRVGVGELAQRRPTRLSGGQAQRVALARALAAEPELLLLDEPMAALDVAVAPALRHTLQEVLADRTTVLLVTHDVLDALLLADRVVVMEGGRVVETGATREVLRRPRSRFAARIAGLNLVAGHWDGTAVVGALSVQGLAAAEPPRPGAAAVAVFSPGSVSVFREPPVGSPRNVLPATVTQLEPLGDRFRVRTVAAGVPLDAEVTAAAVADLGLVPGLAVNLIVKATEVSVHAVS